MSADFVPIRVSAAAHRLARALAPALALSVFVRSRIGNTSRVVRAIGGVTDRSNLLPLAGATRITEHRDTRHRFSQRLVSRRAPLRLGTQAWRGPLTACLAAAQAARALGALRAHALVLGPGPHPGSGHSGRTALLLAASRTKSAIARVYARSGTDASVLHQHTAVGQHLPRQGLWVRRVRWSMAWTHTPAALPLLQPRPAPVAEAERARRSR